MEAISTTRCLSTMSMSMSAMVAAEQLVDEGAVHLDRMVVIAHDLQTATPRHYHTSRICVQNLCNM